MSMREPTTAADYWSLVEANQEALVQAVRDRDALNASIETYTDRIAQYTAQAERLENEEDEA